jgi:hypothetical protein
LNLNKTDESEARDLPEAKIKKQSRISMVWIVPLFAAIVGGWLVFKYIRQAGRSSASSSATEMKLKPIKPPFDIAACAWARSFRCN